MVSASVAAAMTEVFAQKHGLTREEAAARMREDPSLLQLLTSELSGVSTALTRDRLLAFGQASGGSHDAAGRLAPLLSLMDKHVHEPTAGSVAPVHAVDLAAGTAVYTTAFAEHFPWLQFHASDAIDPGSSREYPTGLAQTKEALCAMRAECEPEAVTSDGRRLLFVSDGPCAVREGDVVRLCGLQQRTELNGALGTMCTVSKSGAAVAANERLAVLLEGASTPMALKPANLLFEKPGCVRVCGGGLAPRRSPVRLTPPHPARPTALHDLAHCAGGS
jgi:hypothetical protein